MSIIILQYEGIMRGKRGFATGSHYRKYYYTVRDVARVTGRAEGTIRNDVYAGRLNMSDLRSIAEYIMMEGRQ